MGHKKICKSFFEILAPTKREKVAHLAIPPVQALEGREAFSPPPASVAEMVVAATMNLNDHAIPFPCIESKMNPDPAKPTLPDVVDAAIALEQVALVALREPNLTPEEREILEKAVGFARGRQKRLPPPEVES